MSTRSGKRIHRSFHGSGEVVVAPSTTMSERKTRSKKQNENHDTTTSKPKLRENYVRYPSEDEDDKTVLKENKQKRKLRKNNLLKDLNIDSVIKITKNEILKEVVRETRRSKRFVDDTELVQVNGSPVKSTKKRKGVNKLKRNSTEIVNTGKKSKNKKKKKSSIDVKTVIETSIHDKSNTSINSYSTAIGSPVNDALSMKKMEPEQDDLFEIDTNDKTAIKIESTEILNNMSEDINDLTKIQDNTFETVKTDQVVNKKAGCRNSTFDKSIENIITSNNSKLENILNNTPLLIESSMETSPISSSSKSSITPLASHSTPSPSTTPVPSTTPLKREGTFTIESPSSDLNGTFTKEDSSCTPEMPTVPAAGNTPYHSNRKRKINVTHSVEKSLNVTHSIEKPKGCQSIIEVNRQTRVMFCSPADNPLNNTQTKTRIIKSSIKGSNKSFVYDQDVSSTVKRSGARKRSFTHGDAGDRAKRLRLNEDLTQSVNRLSRPRTTSAVVKSAQKEQTAAPSKSTPYQSKSEKVSRSKLPNFAALHQKQFDKMESLDECQLRKAQRAKKLMSPTSRLAVLEKKRSSGPNSPKPEKKEPPKATLGSLIPRPTSFRFNANYHINPFSVPTEKKPQKSTIKRELSQPSLKGMTLIERKIGVKELREKSIQGKRKEYRDIIKGVRTNRRFELQMKSRSIQP